MADNIFQKKEKQEILKQAFVFLTLFVFLMIIMPPSFQFSPKVELEEKRDYSEIVVFLDEFDFNQFDRFSMIPEFEGTPGRVNPFSDDFQETAREDFIVEDDEPEDQDIDDEPEDQDIDDE